MITNYNNFVKINEEKEFGSNKAAKGIGGMFKKMLGGLVKDVKDELKKPLEDFNKKLGNEKDKDRMIKVTRNYLKTHQNTLNKSMEEATTVPEILKVITDNLTTAYASIKASIENFGDQNYTFDELFQNAPAKTKKLFSKDQKKFDKNVEQYAKDLLLSFGKTYDLEESDLEKTEKEAKSENEKEKIAQAQGETTEESLNFNNYEKIFEAISTDDIPKFKEDIIKWFNNTIYKNIDRELDDLKKEDKKEENEQPKDLNDVVDNIPDNVTDNKDSVKAMINKLAETDKNTLIKIRDMLGLNKENTPL